MSNAAAPTHPDLKDTLEEMRASVAARGARNGLTRAMQRLMLTILEMFLTLLADFRAGKLAPVVAAAKDAVDCPSPSLKGRGIQGSASLANGTEYTVAYPPPQPSPSGPIAPCAMGARSRGEGEANRCFSARTAAMADGLPADARAGRNVLVRWRDGLPLRIRSGAGSARECPVVLVTRDQGAKRMAGARSPQFSLRRWDTRGVRRAPPTLRGATGSDSKKWVFGGRDLRALFVPA